MKRSTVQPLAGPAVAVALGTWLALHLCHLPVPALAGLSIASLASGRRRLRLVAWAAMAAGLTLARGLPAAAVPRTETVRPVEVELTVVGHPRFGDGQASTWVRIERLRQDRQVQRAAIEALLAVPIAERGELWLPGTRLRARGYLVPAAVYRNGGPGRAPAWRLKVPSPLLIDQVAAAPKRGALAASVRQRIEDAWTRRGAGRPSARLAFGLLLGDPSRLPVSWVQALRRSGLGHVLAVSGLHLTLVLGCTMIAAWWLPRPAKLASAMAAAWLFLAIVGARPSVERAALMAAIGLVSLALARPPVARNALAASVLLLVLHHPPLVARLAFHLTVAATFAMVAWAPRLRRRGLSTGSPIRSSWSMSVAAHLGTVPISLPAFGWLPTAGILINLLAVPWLALTMAIYLLATAVGCLRPAVGVPFVDGLDALARPVAWLSALPAGPWLGVPLGVTALGAWAGAIAVAVALTAGWRARLVCLALGASLIGHQRAPGAPELVLLDVGQGDAILLRDGRHAWLVDGGGWPRGDLGGRVLVPALGRLGVRRLDGVLLSHADRDHCQGLVDLASYVRVGTLLSSRHARARPCGAELAEKVGHYRRAAAGSEVVIGRWRLTVLASGDEMSAASWSDNDRSTVVMATVHGRRVLLTGDIEGAMERWLMTRFTRLEADLLKVAHHGSATSTRRGLVDLVRPRWAMISAGRRNPFGHPSRRVVERLRAAGARVIRTDRDGAVRVSFPPHRPLVPDWIGLAGLGSAAK